MGMRVKSDTTHLQTVSRPTVKVPAPQLKARVPLLQGVQVPPAAPSISHIWRQTANGRAMPGHTWEHNAVQQTYLGSNSWLLLSMGSAIILVAGYALNRLRRTQITHVTQPAQQPVAMATFSGFKNPFAGQRAVPKDIKGTVSQMRDSVQKALEGRVSRMDVELPVAAKFGVENDKQSEKEKGIRGYALQKSDRELARLFIEMFDPIGESVVVAFADQVQAETALEKWATIKGTVISIPQKQKSKGGFGAKGADAEVDLQTAAALQKAEVVLVVAPTKSEWDWVERVCKEKGNACCIILLNARLHAAAFKSLNQKDYIKTQFKPIYQLRPLLEPDGGVKGVEGILVHTYPEGYLVARKPKVGPPNVLWEGQTKPDPNIVSELLKKDAGEGVDGVISSVSTFFTGESGLG